MSRTTRKSADDNDKRCVSEIGDCDDYKNLDGRDGQEDGMPSSWKRLMRKSIRAKEKSALRSGRLIPLFPKTHFWDWF